MFVDGIVSDLGPIRVLETVPVSRERGRLVTLTTNVTRSVVLFSI